MYQVDYVCDDVIFSIL